MKSLRPAIGVRLALLTFAYVYAVVARSAWQQDRLCPLGLSAAMSFAPLTVAWLGTSLLLGIAAFAANRMGRSNAAVVLGILGFLMSALAEGRATYRRIRYFEPVKSTSLLLREAGERAIQIHSARGEYPALPDLDLGRDAWGHPLVYSRISPQVVMIASPGADGKLSTPLGATYPEQNVAVGDVDHDLAIRLDGEQLLLVAYPHGSPSCPPCLLPSLLGCFRYYAEEAGE